jgi:PTH1 family peptidyl-tRNA hydrolase
MSLFQQKPELGTRINYTTFGQNRTLLFVGLGNPGAEYKGSRHNTGFLCLDNFARKSGFDPWVNKKDLKSLVTSKTLGDTRVILCKPTTFMNLSGEAVQAVAHFYKVHPHDIVVVHDELDINFGQIRMRMGGSAAGNNGIKSVSQHIGEDYGRVRVGVGPKTPEQIDAADFVLQDFSKTEQAELQALTLEVSAVLSEYAYGAGVTAETRNFLA